MIKHLDGDRVSVGSRKLKEYQTIVLLTFFDRFIYPPIFESNAKNEKISLRISEIQVNDVTPVRVSVPAPVIEV